jgi:hypothetical protein
MKKQLEQSELKVPGIRGGQRRQWPHHEEPSMDLGLDLQSYRKPLRGSGKQDD